MHCFDLFMLIDGNAVSCLSSAFFQKDKSLLRYWICIRSWLVVMTFSDGLLCIAYVECLVGGFKHFLFSIIYGIIIPTDQYFSEGLKPPTRCLFYGVVMTVCCEMTSRFGWFSPAHPSEESHGGESGAASLDGSGRIYDCQWCFNWPSVGQTINTSLRRCHREFMNFSWDLLGSQAARFVGYRMVPKVQEAPRMTKSWSEIGIAERYQLFCWNMAGKMPFFNVNFGDINGAFQVEKSSRNGGFSMGTFDHRRVFGTNPLILGSTLWLMAWFDDLSIKGDE